jgi:SAM-dependent methyltransferase
MRCPRTLVPVVVALALLLVATPVLPSAPRTPDVHYVPTPQQVVDRMLELANVTSRDIVYDLGSGDGRIVITAARRYGARGIGIDIDPERVTEARENAQRAGVTDRVQFIQGDLFESDFREATVVTLYLLQSLNLKLRPKLLSELRPGTRVVSHAFDMGDWEPDHAEAVNVDGRDYMVYYWVVPPRAVAR